MAQPSPASHASGDLPLDGAGETLRTFLGLMPDAAVAVDRQGTIVAVNVRVESSFGYTAEELEGKPIEILVPERFRHTHRKERSTYNADPRARPMGAGLDLYARRRDGTEFPVDISLAPVTGASGQLVVAAVRDITERKASHSAEAQLAAIVRSSADAIFSITREGLITSWNPAAETMFGYERSLVIGHHISQFFPDDPIFEDLLDGARSGRSRPSHDTRWQTAGDGPIDVAISVSLLGTSDDAGYSLLVRDITVRKAAEAQLRRQALWQAATAEIRLSLLSDAPVATSLDLICKWAVQLSSGAAAAIFLELGGPPRPAAQFGDPFVVRSLAETEAIHTEEPENGGATTMTCTAAEGHGLEIHAVSLPFAKSAPETARRGVLAIASTQGATEVPDLQEVLASLASQAVLALELANVRSERDRLLISADRERIARDLHDLVIQRLFGAGLRLQGTLGLIDNQAVSARVASAIDDLDTTIKEIREAIFALESPPGTGLRARLAAVVGEAAEMLGFEPEFHYDADGTEEVPLQVQLEAAAVLREALSNTARHSRASSTKVDVTVRGALHIAVVDNGVGLGPKPGSASGLANARARAELLGGHLELSVPSGGGTCFKWAVPLDAAKTG